MNSLQDIFISYGRTDSKQFVKRLNDRLVAQGYTVWFDFDAIPQGVDYQKQINDGIEKADNFVFVISPHATKSPYCRKEIERAVALNKRLVPIMHVEEISQELWQTRHPDGTDEDWAAYQASGEHSCFTHMHSEISKINWNQVNFADESNFESAFQALVELCEQERTYVHQHTVLLTKALDWDRNQQQTRYLLVGEERQQAEEWLQKRFQDKQAPCTPTDLHCEFIIASIKNANNLMTQVFLCHAEEDQTLAEQIRRGLMRDGITAWTHRSDIEFGSDFQTAMARGIEEADNVVFLLSAHSLASPYCQQELDHALASNKRIIPMLAGTVAPEQIPASLQTRQYIDLTDNLTEDSYQQDEGNLLRLLKQDAAYYNEHKILLTKALKWERQQRNPCILLRGYELQHALTWLKLTTQYPEHGPIPLQHEFITESERQPSGVSLDVFISYSRADADFARQLNDGLQRQGKRTWFDQESIASGADFRAEIYRGIEASDHVLFILSPSSVKSPYCADEVEYAAKLNKRIVTVLHRPVETTDLHPQLKNVQWLDFQDNDADFAANFKELLLTLDTDPEYLQAHTRLLMQALTWEEKARRESLLLRGDELKESEQWLLKASGKQPSPTELQGIYVASSRDLINADQKKEAKRQRRLVGTLGGLLTMAISGFGIAVWQYGVATTQKNRAEAAQQRAEIGEQAAQARLLSYDKPVDGLVMAMQVVGESQHSLNQVLNSAQFALADLLKNPMEVNLLEGHTQAVIAIATSPDGNQIASSSEDGTVRIWDLEGNLVVQPMQGHTGYVNAIAFSPDGQYLVTASSDTTLRLWDLTNSNDSPRVFEGHQNKITSVAFSPDGEQILSGGDDGMKLWNRQGSVVNEFTTLAGKQVNSVAFLPNNQTIISASGTTVQFWDRTGKLLGTPINKAGESITELHAWAVNTVAVSPNGKFLATTGNDSFIKLIDVETRQVRKTFQEDVEAVGKIAFDAESERVAIALENSIKIRNLQGVPISSQNFGNHQGNISAVAWHPELPETLITGSWDTTVRLWDTTQLTERFPRANAETDWIQALLDRACNRLKSHPRLLLEPTDKTITAGTTCRQQVWEDVDEADFLVLQGRKLAQQDNIQEAVAKFEAANELDPTLEIEPETEAQRLAAFAAKPPEMALLRVENSRETPPIQVTYGQVSLSEFALNGEGNTIDAAPGEVIYGSTNYRYDCPDCAGDSINQIIVGIAGENAAQACIYNGFSQAEGASTFTLRAPEIPGRYDIRFRYAQAFGCEEGALGWWRVDSEPTAAATIGTIVVTNQQQKY
ncbi:MAG: TIR domain-containing protein [Cyanobacteria bacterium J06649_12]